MKLYDANVVFFDCQTTGRIPPAGQMIELAWSTQRQKSDASPASSLVALAPGQTLSARIRGLTGIDAEQLSNAPDLPQVRRRLHRELAVDVPMVIHYARFEAPFLKDLGLFDRRRIYCTYEIARRLYADLPSKSIRAVAGYMGYGASRFKRSADHVAATQLIWRRVTERLSKQEGVETFQDLDRWLEGPVPKRRDRQKTYALDRKVRLGLPSEPGIYLLKNQRGQVLYVGKATCLKNRVNSYFRGRKTKGSRLNELVSQVADVEVYVVGSPLEAAIVEADAIKSHVPPYNKALQREGREIAFCDRQFLPILGSRGALGPRAGFGPFSSRRFVEHVFELRQAVEQPEGIDDEIMRQGVDLYRQEVLGLGEDDRPNWRKVLVRAWVESIRKSREKRREAQDAARADDDPSKLVDPMDGDDEDEEQLALDDAMEAGKSGLQGQEALDPESVSRHLARSVAGFARRIHRGRWLRRLANCQLYWRRASDDDGHDQSWLGAHSLDGVIVFARPTSNAPWLEFSGETRQRRPVVGTSPTGFPTLDSPASCAPQKTGTTRTTEIREVGETGKMLEVGLQFDISVYDRMSVFAMEIRRLLRTNNHEVILCVDVKSGRRFLVADALRRYMFTGDFLV